MPSELIRSSANRVLGLMAAAAAILAGSAVLAWPAWYLATARRSLFNALLAALAALLLAAVLVRALRRRRGREAGR